MCTRLQGTPVLKIANKCMIPKTIQLVWSNYKIFPKTKYKIICVIYPEDFLALLLFLGLSFLAKYDIPPTGAFVKNDVFPFEDHFSVTVSKKKQLLINKIEVRDGREGE